MLQTIRGRANSFIVKALFGLLAFSFVGWGIAGYLTNFRNRPAAVEIGAVEMPQPVFVQQIDRRLQQMRQSLGVDRDQSKQLGLVDQAIRQTVDESRLAQEADRLGISVSDARVVQEAQSNPAFHDEQGRFDRARFQTLLARVGYTEASFAVAVRHELILDQLTKAVMSAAHPPAVITERLLAYRDEQRVAQVAALPFDKAPDAGKPSAAEVDAYYQSHHSAFMAPEYRALSYLALSAADLAPAVQVSDEEARAAFKDRQAEFKHPEKRTVEQILFPSEDKAKAAAATLAAGGAFTKAAADAGMKPDDVALGSVTKEELPPALADAGFALAAGAVSAPVKSDFGWHLVRVAQIEPAHDESFDDAKPKLVAELRQAKASDELYDRANKLEAAIDGGATLAQAAEKFGLPVKAAAAVDADGRGADGKPVAELPYPAALLAAAAPLAVGKTSGAVQVKDQDAFIIVAVAGVTPPALRPLADARESVVTAWRAEKRELIVQARAKGLVEKLRAGVPLDQLAKQEKLEVKTTAPLPRDASHVTAIPAAALGQLFEAKAIGAASMTRADDGYLLIQLKEIKTADPAALTEQRAGLASQIKQEMAADIEQTYAAALAARFPAKYDERAIVAAF